LTIKFTRHTAASPPAFSFWLSALSYTTTRRANSMGLDPAHRTQHRISLVRRRDLCETSKT